MAPKERILIVEDDSDDAELVKMVLEKEGYETIGALNGKEALDRVRSDKPALIVLDVMMPEMDGFAFCSKLRASPEHKDIPVVLLTAVAQRIHDTAYPLDGVMRAQAEEYVEKPIEPKAFVDTVARLLA